MKLPNWLKIIWWLILFGFVTYLISLRFNSIISGSSDTTDIIIFLIWIALFAIPLFQEVSFFGVGLKKEIGNLKSELSSFKSEIRNTISLKTEISPTFNIPAPPTDSELASLEERIRPILEQTIKELGIERPTPASEAEFAPDRAQYLFYTRYAIENELKRVFNLTFESRGKKYYQTPLRMARALFELGEIAPELYETIREVYAICSAGIHGEDVSEKAFRFVQDVAPSLIATLGAKESIDWTSR